MFAGAFSYLTRNHRAEQEHLSVQADLTQVVDAVVETVHALQENRDSLIFAYITKLPKFRHIYVQGHQETKEKLHKMFTVLSASAERIGTSDKSGEIVRELRTFQRELVRIREDFHRDELAIGPASRLYSANIARIIALLSHLIKNNPHAAADDHLLAIQFAVQMSECASIERLLTGLGIHHKNFDAKLYNRILTVQGKLDVLSGLFKSFIPEALEQNLKNIHVSEEADRIIAARALLRRSKGDQLSPDYTVIRWWDDSSNYYHALTRLCTHSVQQTLSFLTKKQVAAEARNQAEIYIILTIAGAAALVILLMLLLTFRKAHIFMRLVAQAMGSEKAKKAPTRAQFAEYLTQREQQEMQHQHERARLLHERDALLRLLGEDVLALVAAIDQDLRHMKGELIQQTRNLIKIENRVERVQHKKLKRPPTAILLHLSVRRIDQVSGICHSLRASLEDLVALKEQTPEHPQDNVPAAEERTN